jgi:hypothetical protein
MARAALVRMLVMETCLHCKAKVAGRSADDELNNEIRRRRTVSLPTMRRRPSCAGAESIFDLIWTIALVVTGLILLVA